MSAHNEELSDLYCSPNVVRVIKLRRMRWAGHVTRMGIGYIYTYIYTRIHTAFWWGDLRERPLGRPRRRWEDNIKMDLQEVGWKDWGNGLD